MTNKEFGKEMQKRTLMFSNDLISAMTKMNNNIEKTIIKKQIIRSCTSIGANYHEANRARSLADFRNKIRICESESSETIYWLQLIVLMNWLPKSIWEPLLKECNELIALFTTISNKILKNQKL